MHLLLAAINQATRRNEIKSNLQLGSNSNRYAPRLPQQETKIIYKTACSDGPILSLEKLLKTGFAQNCFPSCPSGRHKPQSFIETKTLRFCHLDTKNFSATGTSHWGRLCSTGTSLQRATFFPSNAFMASARSFNMFESMLQFGLII